MNWIDWTILALLAYAMIRGLMRGFFVELAGLLALVLGIWGGLKLNDKVAELIGLDPSKEAISFLVTLVIIMVFVHLVGRVITKLVDVAQLGLLNKLGGAALGAISKAFFLSVLLNIAFAKHDSAWAPSFDAQKDSKLFAPLRAFAPFFVPALGNSKWVLRAWDELKAVVDGADTE